MPSKTFAQARQIFLKYLAVHHYADSTQENYAACVNAYERYLRSHPDTAHLTPAKKIESYLTQRVLEDDVKPSTQNVELNALVLFYACSGRLGLCAFLGVCSELWQFSVS